MTSLKTENISSNRSFGIVFFVVFLLIALWPLKSGGDIRLWSLVLSIIFIILGLLNSKLLYPLNKLWFKFGILIGTVVSPIIMGIVYFAVVTPIGIFLRIIGKDLLRLKKSKKMKSYWLDKEKIKSTMKNQF